MGIGLGPLELIIVGVIAVLLFGNRLPSVMRSMGQGMIEFKRGMRDVAGKVGTALTRSACCAAGLSRASTWRLTLGRDHDRNWAALAPLLS